MNNAKTIDIDLVRRCQKGCSDAFDSLYDRFGNRIWQICCRMTGNPSEAEDLAQEIWLVIWRQIGDFRCESAFSTWIYRIAVNTCLQWRRRKRIICSDETDESIPAHECSPEQVFIRNETIERTLSALMRLPDSLRIPLILRINDDLSYAEIAEVLNCTSAAVKMRVSRARMALAKALEGEIE